MRLLDFLKTETMGLARAEEERVQPHAASNEFASSESGGTGDPPVVSGNLLDNLNTFSPASLSTLTTHPASRIPHPVSGIRHLQSWIPHQPFNSAFAKFVSIRITA